MVIYSEINGNVDNDNVKDDDNGDDDFNDRLVL